ncbi:MAG: histidinol-phosphate transaminase [Oceanospirillales bacterium]|nr:histidinol-phosphate transaminase [Oceanospirillales bacterium]
MSIDFYSQAVPSITALSPYRPGKPAGELQREMGLSDIISLASNENPLGPSPRALAAASAALKRVERYPDGAGFELKAALSSAYNVGPERITLGNGSNELLNLVARVFVRPGDEVIYSQYAFIAYPIATRACQAHPVEVPAKMYGHDLTAMAGAVTERTRLIYLANPNNPTGTAFSDSALRAFLDAVPAHVVVVLDEAYTEYVDVDAGLPNGLALIDEYDNLVVTRTFSKAFGLAGLRVGFAVSNPQISDLMNRIREPFNINVAAQAAAAAVLTDSDYLQQVLDANRRGMVQVSEGLRRLAVEFLTSQGNFVTLDLKRDAQPVFDSLLRQGVIVRPLQPYNMPHHLRVTIGLEQENARFLAALERALMC